MTLLCASLSLRLLRINSSSSVEDSDDCEGSPKDKENGLDSKKEVGVSVCKVLNCCGNKGQMDMKCDRGPDNSIIEIFLVFCLSI